MAFSCSRPVSRSGSRNSWDALADIEVFIEAADAELAAMHRERIGVHCRGTLLHGSAAPTH